MNHIFEFFDKLNEEKYLKKEITVYGWQFNYSYTLKETVVPYLFLSPIQIENIAGEKNENRDGRIREKKYITIHDTGDTLSTHTAKFWSDTVYNEKLMDNSTPYAASFQYVVGNDGIYHNIPDNEIAYHAGDSTKFDYKLYPTKVKAKKECIVTIENGMIFINGENTEIEAPHYQNDGVDRYCTTEEINSQGILVKEVDGFYAIGEIYFNKTYNLIANRGGNNNSIGIEMCINEGCDLYLNYLQTARLVARLMDENNLTIDDVKQHHYFSGKNCPETLRRNNLWDYFIHLINVAVRVQSFIKEGYQISFVPMSSDVDENGKIKETSIDTKAAYQIVVKKDGILRNKTYVKSLE